MNRLFFQIVFTSILVAFAPQDSEAAARSEEPLRSFSARPPPPLPEDSSLVGPLSYDPRHGGPRGHRTRYDLDFGRPEGFSPGGRWRAVG